MRKVFGDNERKETAFLWCVFGIFFILVLKCCFYWSTGLIDTVEHTQASWLVSTGQIPYKDFFEHHSSLMWYVLAPLVKIFEYKIYIIYIVRVLAVLLYFLCFILMYHIISKHLANKQTAEYSLLYIMMLPIVDIIIEMRPDIFMLLCNLLSLNFLYNYLDNKRRKNLIISYVLLSFSFLFLQKSLFFIFSFGVGNLYLLCRKKLVFKDCLISAIAALIPLALFAAYLYDVEAFSDYYFYNFIFNFQLVEYYNKVDLYINNLDVYTFVSFIVFIRFFPKDDKNMFLALIVLGQIVSLLNFAPYTHYYLPCLLYMSVTMGYCLQKLFSFRPLLTAIVYVVIICFSFYRIGSYNPPVNPLFEDFKYLAQPQKKVLNLGYGCVYCQPASYYGFSFDNAVIIDDMYNFKDIDINKLISSQEADYIYMPRKIIGYIDANKNKWNVLYNQKVVKAATVSEKPEKYVQKIKKITLDYWNIDKENLLRNYVKVKETSNEQIWKRKK